MRYASIFARTRHIGPPQRVYDLLYDWGVRNEGFASPFNARMLGTPEGVFFSAFPNTDGFYGSRGSFFESTLSDYPGGWCVDPPFIKETLDRACEKLRPWLATDVATPVLFICPSDYAMPLEVDETVTLRAGHHIYEGMSGESRQLPLDVAIHRIGEMEGFDAAAVLAGYEPQR